MKKSELKQLIKEVMINEEKNEYKFNNTKAVFGGNNSVYIN
jgi:hypothetical protein